jgi:hypothetical protein
VIVDNSDLLWLAVDPLESEYRYAVKLANAIVVATGVDDGS